MLNILPIYLVLLLLLLYKSFCISRLLYGLEIISINKKTLNKLNVSQNNIIRYIHISNTRKILRILSINNLYDYMK
jgi:hypothetical protein